MSCSRPRGGDEGHVRQDEKVSHRTGPSAQSYDRPVPVGRRAYENIYARRGTDVLYMHCTCMLRVTCACTWRRKTYLWSKDVVSSFFILLRVVVTFRT